MTQVIFIEKLVNGSYLKKVTTSERSTEKFCVDASEYYASIGIETEVRVSQEDSRFIGVFSCRNNKLMVIAGPEKNKFFWHKYTLIKKAVEEANDVPQKPKGQKFEFYAVISAEFTGFVRTWTKCKEFTNGKSAKYKGFNSIEAAKTWMRENHAASKTFEYITNLKQIK